jgi:hypothetical protein
MAHTRTHTVPLAQQQSRAFAIAPKVLTLVPPPSRPSLDQAKPCVGLWRHWGNRRHLRQRPKHGQDTRVVKEEKLP